MFQENTQNPNLFYSSLSNNEAVEMQQHGSHINAYSWLKMYARCEPRQVVVVVIYKYKLDKQNFRKLYRNINQQQIFIY